jgi:hypothetical protein
MPFWKKRIGSEEPSETIAPKPELNLASSPRERCLAVYVFDSDQASKRSGFYGSYLEGEFLKALYRALPTDQGWMAEPMFSGFHGDLFEQGVYTVREWLSGDTSSPHFDPLARETWLSNTPLHFIPYAIGVGTIQSVHAVGAHEKMKEQSVGGYVGLLTPNAMSVVTLARSLGLSCDLRMHGTRCSGWLASSAALSEAGLHKSESTSRS